MDLDQRGPRRAKQATSVQDVVVATDHEEIARVARDHHATVILTSPECPTGTDRSGAATMPTPTLRNSEQRHAADSRGGGPRGAAHSVA